MSKFRSDLQRPREWRGQGYSRPYPDMDRVQVPVFHPYQDGVGVPGSERTAPRGRRRKRHKKSSVPDLMPTPSLESQRQRNTAGPPPHALVMPEGHRELTHKGETYEPSSRRRKRRKKRSVPDFMPTPSLESQRQLNTAGPPPHALVMPEGHRELTHKGGTYEPSSSLYNFARERSPMRDPYHSQWSKGKRHGKDDTRIDEVPRDELRSFIPMTAHEGRHMQGYPGPIGSDSYYSSRAEENPMYSDFQDSWDGGQWRNHVSSPAGTPRYDWNAEHLEAPSSSARVPGGNLASSYPQQSSDTNSTSSRGDGGHYRHDQKKPFTMSYREAGMDGQTHEGQDRHRIPSGSKSSVRVSPISEPSSSIHGRLSADRLSDLPRTSSSSVISKPSKSQNPSVSSASCVNFNQPDLGLSQNERLLFNNLLTTDLGESKANVVSALQLRLDQLKKQLNKQEGLESKTPAVRAKATEDQKSKLSDGQPMMNLQYLLVATCPPKIEKPFHINNNLSSPPGTTFREGNSGSSYREYSTNRDYQPQYPTEGLGPQHGSDSTGVAVTSDKRSSNSCRAGAITAVIDYNHGIRLADGVGEHHQPAGNSSTAAVRTSAVVERSSLSSVEIPPLGVAPRAVNKDLMQVQELLKKWRAELTTLSLQVQGLEENWNKACMAKVKSLEKITESEMRLMSELSFVQREMSRYSTSHRVDEGLRERCEYIQLELNRLKAVQMAVSGDVELAGNQERDLKSARTQMKDLEDNIRLMKEKEQLLLQESVQKFSHAVEQHRPPQPLPAKVSVPMIPATDPIVKPSEPAAEASFSANTDSMQTDLQKNLDDIRELLGKWRAKLAASNAEMKSLEDAMNAQVKAKLATVKKLGEVEGRLLTELRSIESEKLKAFVTGQQDRKMEEQRRQIQQQLEQVRTHKVEMSTNNTQHSRLCTERLLKVKKEVAELEENIKSLHEKERNMLDALAESFTH